MKKKWTTKNTKVYSDNVIALLKDFCVTCTKKQRRFIYSLPTEEAVDRYKQALIKEVMENA